MPIWIPALTWADERESNVYSPSVHLRSCIIRTPWRSGLTLKNQYGYGANGSVRHQYRYSHVVQHVASASATVQTGEGVVSVGTHDDQVTILIGTSR